ncbi:uncharacterized protein LOC110892992 [Helianthus annuus]|uniref:uncharacterized protein LOC110892992 n=1 Tax=Helianthus annuus TaxID=4232 RepID=UPI000B8FF199|nr:uncharacterized protein LOC110892992 [Helianthus annuus]
MMLFKVDFEKAFDSISWEFMESVLAQMGFPGLWRKWVMGILKTARSSILVNGSPTAEFEIQRGVRQGDPLSPLLFILAMEALHIATESAVNCNIFKGITTPVSRPTVSHLLYADDVLFVGEWSEENFHNLARLLRCFHLSSGLKVNFSKSRVFGVGVGNGQVSEMATIVGCEKGLLPLSYLGSPVGSNMGLVISTYYFSLFSAPVHVIKYLEKVRRQFLWGGCLEKNKMCWVPWFKVVAPKKQGGLGIGSLASMNKAMMVKWIVKFRNEFTHLWARVIMAIHGRNRNYPSIPVMNSISGVWKNIVQLGKGANLNLSDVESRLEVQLGCGNKTFFWLDKWAGDFLLKEQFPPLFALQSDKRCLVQHRYTMSDGSINWTWGGESPISLSEIANMWEDCVNRLQTVQINMKSDRWLWKQDQDREEFRVGNLCSELDAISMLPENTGS